MKDHEIFIDAMREHVPPDARLILINVPGDSDTAESKEWWGKRYNKWDVEEKQNVYITLGAFRLDDDRKLRRKDSSWVGMTGILFDDIGSGIGSKGTIGLDDLLKLIEPTAVIRTSWDNYQVLLLFDELMTDAKKYYMIIDAIIRKFFNGKDPGMHGLTRIFRPGVGMNLKAKYEKDGEFPRVEFERLDVEKRYSPDEIVKAFDLELIPHAEKQYVVKCTQEQVAARKESFDLILLYMTRLGLMKKRPSDNFFDSDGWARCECPFADGYDNLEILPHSGGGTAGAQIRRPHAENDFFGSFVCFHSHGQRKLEGGRPNNIGWRHLVDWVDTSRAGDLELINLSYAIDENGWKHFFEED